MTYRLTQITPDSNRALRACSTFQGDALIVEAEHDDLVPHSTIMNYVASFRCARSLTYRIVDNADHGLTSRLSQQAYTSVLANWMTEMVVGSRVGGGTT